MFFLIPGCGAQDDKRHSRTKNLAKTIETAAAGGGERGRVADSNPGGAHGAPSDTV